MARRRPLSARSRFLRIPGASVRSVAFAIGAALSSALVACSGSSSGPSGTSSQQSTLTFTSQPGDFIGGGRTYNFTAATATFRHAIDPPYPGSIVIDVLSKDLQSNWTVSMGALDGQELQVGQYANAISWSARASSQPRFSLWGDGRGCGSSEAQFAILEVVRGASVLVSTGALVPSVQRLHLQFSQRCTATSAPGLTGELWFISTSS